MIKLDKLSFVDHVIYTIRRKFVTKQYFNPFIDIELPFQDFVNKKIFDYCNEFGFVRSDTFDCAVFTRDVFDIRPEHKKLFFNVDVTCSIDSTTECRINTSDARLSICTCNPVCIDDSFLEYHISTNRIHPDYYIIKNCVVEGTIEDALVSLCAIYKLSIEELFADKEKLDKVFDCLLNVKTNELGNSPSVKYVLLDI